MKSLVDSRHIPGIIGYIERKPVGWCSVAPRSDFVFLSHSRVLAPVDERQVWSISCLYVDKKFRRNNISVLLLKAALEYVRKRGGKVVEAYPVVPYSDQMPDAFAWTGIESAYKRAGFKEALRRSRGRPIMRYYL